MAPELRHRRGTIWWGTTSLVVYHLVFLVLVALGSPILLWKLLFQPRFRNAMRDRIGRVSATEPGKRCVWIHGVSVGEVKGAGTLIERIRREHPDLEVVVSTTTSTGQKVARESYPDVRVIYYPADFGHFPGRALDRIRPCAVLLMELEIWPNFLHAAARRDIPIAVINGRISQRSFRGYRWFRWLLPQFRYLTLYCVQIGVYRDRLTALGVAPERIVVTGNMKYDSVRLKTVSTASVELRGWLTQDDRQVVVCGSTHGREDEWVARALDGLSASRPVRLVTVPRHPERADAVVEGLRAIGFTPIRWTACDRGALPRLGDRDVVVVDCVGQLEDFYGASDVVFVGGSLVPHGGQNMIEPAALGKPVLFGPHIENFRTDVELLLDADAVVQIAGVSELGPALLRLLEDGSIRAAFAERASDVIRANQGATDRTYMLIRSLLVPRQARSA